MLLSLKRNVSQTFKSSSCKKAFPKCVYHGYNLLRKMLFIPCDTGWYYFYTNLSLPKGLMKPSCCCSLKQVFWKKSTFYIRYLHNNTTMLLIPKVHNKIRKSVDSVFYSFISLWMFYIFLYNGTSNFYDAYLF